MKSLKRSLCLVLALVMVLGMFGAASATSFTDDASIQYKEAVDVMVGIGAINGMGDGTFAPKGTITRAEAAKMVTYAVLGPDVAAALSGVTSSFTDVNANFAWAIPSIEYLVKQGVINGYPGGTFEPNGNVTGYEIAKMLLCAIGYGKLDEYVGSGWELNVAIDANKYGVFTGSKATSYAVAATREESALYCFNALTNDKAYQVVYSKLLESYTPKTFAEGATKTIGQEVYNLTPGVTSDSYGRPATGWTAVVGGRSKKIAVATAAPVLTYTTAVKPTTIALALQNLGCTTNVGTGNSATLYTNGVDVDFTKNEVDAFFAGTTAIGGDGMLIEVYVNSLGVLNTIVVVNTHLGQVTKFGKDNAATTTIDERTLTIAFANGKTAEANADTAGFDAVYSVAVTSLSAGKPLPVLCVPTKDLTDDGSALSIAIPETVVGTITRTTSAGVYTIGGKDYKLSYTNNLSATDKQIGTTATFLLDTYGNIIGAVSAATNVTVYYGVGIDYLYTEYVAPSLADPAGKAAAEIVRFVDASGTVQTLSTAFKTGADGKIVAPIAPDKTWVATGVLFAYTLDASGKIASIAPATTGATTEDITKGQALFDGKYMTDSTVVFYADAKGNMAVYTGYKNVITKTDATAYAAIMNAGAASNSYAALLIMVGSVAPSSTPKIVYFASDAVSVETTSAGPVYTYTDVYLDGVAGTLSFTGVQSGVTGKLYTYTETNGVATLNTPALTTLSTNNKVDAVQSGYFVYNTSSVVYTSGDTKFFAIDMVEGTVTPSSALAALSTLYTVNVFYIGGAGTASEPATIVYYYLGVS